MKTLLKWSFRALLAIISLFIVLVIAVWLWFDSDQIKLQIAERVKQQTGADLTIGQDLTLGYFPWVSVETGDISLSQPVGFPQKNALAEIGRLSASIKLAPLFSGDIELGKIDIDHITINLIRNSKGQSNLEALKPQKETEQQESQPEDVQTKSSLKLQQLLLTDVTVNQYDPKQNLTQTFSMSQFSLDEFEPGKVSQIQAEGVFTSGSQKTIAQWELQTHLQLSEDFSVIELRKTEAKLFDTSNKIGTLELTGDSDIHQQKDATQVKHRGSLSVNGQELKVVFDGTFTRFKDITISLKGSHLDLEKVFVAGNKSEDIKQKEADFSPVADFLRTARVKGDLNIDRVTQGKLVLENVSASIANKGKVLWLKPLKAEAFKGTMNTTASIDFASNPIRLSLQPDMQNIQVGDLLGTIFDINKLSGLGTLDLNMSAQGLEVKQILKTLHGSGNINLSDGAINGIDIVKLLENGLSIESLTSKNSYQGKTVFAGLKGAIKADNGLISVNNLMLDSPLFNLSGKATTDAKDESIAAHFQLEAKGALKQLIEQKYPQLAGKRLPFELKGSWQEPAISLDLESLLKAQYSDKLEQEKDKVEDKLKDKLKDFLFKKKKDN